MTKVGETPASVRTRRSQGHAVPWYGAGARFRLRRVGNERNTRAVPYPWIEVGHQAAARCIYVVHEPADSSLRLAHRPVSLPVPRLAGMIRAT